MPATAATHRTANSSLPPSLAPRGLSRVQAAEYVGVSPTKYDQMVVAGLMPRPKRLGGRVVYDRLAIDRAFQALPDDGPSEEAISDNPWD